MGTLSISVHEEKGSTTSPLEVQPEERWAGSSGNIKSTDHHWGHAEDGDWAYQQVINMYTIQFIHVYMYIYIKVQISLLSYINKDS